MLSVLRIATFVSIAISVISLFVLILKTFSFGKKSRYAPPHGSGTKGIIDAFGRGMMPWAKESASHHLPTYIGGLLYHAGIFSALFYLLSVLIPFGLPIAFLTLLRAFIILSLLSGFALLIKRLAVPALKRISCPDDFAANILVGLFLFSALVHTYFARLAPLFLSLAIILFLYIPMGKIRHCFFFFYVRVLFGLFFGRRGVLPRKQRV